MTDDTWAKFLSETRDRILNASYTSELDAIREDAEQRSDEMLAIAALAKRSADKLVERGAENDYACAMQRIRSLPHEEVGKIRQAALDLREAAGRLSAGTHVITRAMVVVARCDERMGQLAAAAKDGAK